MANFIVRSNFGKGHIFGPGKDFFFINKITINKMKDKNTTNNNVGFE